MRQSATKTQGWVAGCVLLGGVAIVPPRPVEPLSASNGQESIQDSRIRPKSNYEKAQSIIGGALGLCYMDLGQPTIEGPFSDPRGAYRSDREPAVEAYLNCVQTYLQESIENIVLYGGDATDKTGELPAEVIKERKHD